MTSHDVWIYELKNIQSTVGTHLTANQEKKILVATLHTDTIATLLINYHHCFTTRMISNLL